VVVTGTVVGGGGGGATVVTCVVVVSGATGTCSVVTGAVVVVGDGFVFVLIGNGDGTFSQTIQLPVGNDPRGVVIVDLDPTNPNNNGRDLAVSNSADDTLTVRPPRSSPREEPPQEGYANLRCGPCPPPWHPSR